MSYCRWSSDDFKCDLYVYENCNSEWTIHIAGSRVMGEMPPQIWPTDASDAEQVAAFVCAEKARSAFLDSAPRLPIGLPHDGETFDLGSPGECADKCEELAEMGYQFPIYVIANLREEQSEMDVEDAALS